MLHHPCILMEISSRAQSDLAPNFTINTELIGVDSSAFAQKMIDLLLRTR
jgi:hypothetical protein